jgi:hypothetical protein
MGEAAALAEVFAVAVTGLLAGDWLKLKLFVSTGDLRIGDEMESLMGDVAVSWFLVRFFLRKPSEGIEAARSRRGRKAEGQRSEGRQ